MDFVARLYDSTGHQVAWDEQYVNGVSNRPPELDPIPVQHGVVGQNLVFTATAADVENDPLSFRGSGMPQGAIVKSVGTFEWTPDAEGTYDIYVSVDDGTTYDSQKVTIIVGSVPSFSDVMIPLCGTTENVTGRIVGLVNVDEYKIASYIFISGSGWWVKPYQDQPTTDIHEDGSFDVDITTGGIDEVATIIYLGICDKDAEIPLLSGASSIPNDLPVLTSQKYYRDPSACHRVIDFGGYRWYVKNSGPGTLGPGPCQFSDSEQNVSVDENGYLHLNIVYDGSKWACAEIVCLETMGYGVYTFELASDVTTLDVNTVLGMFTWADDAENGRELDIEYSRWSNSLAPNGQFAVQPYDLPGHLYRFEFPSTDSPTTHYFQWQEDKVGFQPFVNDGDASTQGQTIADWTFWGEIPVPERVHPRINLWLFNNESPSTGDMQSVVIKNFTFSEVGSDPSLSGMIMLLLKKDE
jgi:Bacterial Ig domain